MNTEEEVYKISSLRPIRCGPMPKIPDSKILSNGRCTYRVSDATLSTGWPMQNRMFPYNVRTAREPDIYSRKKRVFLYSHIKFVKLRGWRDGIREIAEEETIVLFCPSLLIVSFLVPLGYLLLRSGSLTTHE